VGIGRAAKDASASGHAGMDGEADIVPSDEIRYRQSRYDIRKKVDVDAFCGGLSINGSGASDVVSDLGISDGGAHRFEDGVGVDAHLEAAADKISVRRSVDCSQPAAGPVRAY
jgi:hypothetical protein